MLLLRTVLRNKLFSRGFTLTELLVSIAIMTIILGITMSGGPQAIMRLSLADNAYQAELLLREAQLQGSAINSLDNKYGGAGIFFSLDAPSKVLKFRDKVDPSVVRAIGIGDGLYNTSPEDEQDTTFSFINGHRVGKLCVATSTSALMCNTANNPAIRTLTVSFNRPKQIAHIYVNGVVVPGTEYVTGCVQFDSIKSPTIGYVRSIFIYKSGMITKKSGTCN